MCEIVEFVMCVVVEDVCGEFSDVIFNDMCNFMGFYVLFCWLFFECGIIDFSFNDFYKLMYDWLVKIFSYFINFVCFWEL